MNITQALEQIQANFPEAAAAIRDEIHALKLDRAMETDEFNAGYQAFEAGLDVTSAEIEYRSVLPAEVPSYDVFRVGYAWAKECHQVSAND